MGAAGSENKAVRLQAGPGRFRTPRTLPGWNRRHAPGNRGMVETHGNDGNDGNGRLAASRNAAAKPRVMGLVDSGVGNNRRQRDGWASKPRVGFFHSSPEAWAGAIAIRQAKAHSAPIEKFLYIKYLKLLYGGGLPMCKGFRHRDGLYSRAWQALKVLGGGGFRCGFRPSTRRRGSTDGRRDAQSENSAKEPGRRSAASAAPQP